MRLDKEARTMRNEGIDKLVERWMLRNPEGQVAASDQFN
jgi:hypothetical protein